MRMGLFNTKSAEGREERLSKNAARADESELQIAIKEVHKANKAEQRGAKEAHSAAEIHKKAVKKEERISERLHKMQSDHNTAIERTQILGNAYERKNAEQERLHQETLAAKERLSAIQNRVEEGQVQAKAREQEINNQRLQELSHNVAAMTSPSYDTAMHREIDAADQGANAETVAVDNNQQLFNEEEELAQTQDQDQYGQSVTSMNTGTNTGYTGYQSYTPAYGAGGHGMPHTGAAAQAEGEIPRASLAAGF